MTNMTHIKQAAKQATNKVLTFLFPFKELSSRNSVFIQQTWLEKNTDNMHVKDYIWTPSFKQ